MGAGGLGTLAVRKDQLLSGTARAEPTEAVHGEHANPDPARFSAGDRLWAEAWSAAADDGGWLVDNMPPGHSSAPDEQDSLFVYPPASAGRDAAWRRANQAPCIVTRVGAGVVVHEPVYKNLPARRMIFTDLRTALLSLAELTPSLLSLVDALAEAGADFTHGAARSAVPAVGARNRRA